MKLLIASQNKGKIKEIKEIISHYYQKKVEVVDLSFFPPLPSPIENGTSFEENAKIKANYYYQSFEIPVIADDTGLCVNALNGEPGIYSARYASNNSEDATDEDNVKKLLTKLKDVTKREAFFECSAVYYDGKKYETGKGILEGEILSKGRGNNGFGYDPVFYVPSMKKTLAEMSLEEKNVLSHRRKAITNLFEKDLF